MRILLDPEVFMWGRCGFTRYYSALYYGLQERGINVDLPLLISGNDYLKGWPVINATNRLSANQRRALFYSMKLAKRRYFSQLASGRYDGVIITSPNFETDFLDHVGDTPSLMVVLDLIHTMTLPHSFVEIQGDDLKRLCYIARRVTRAICISEATRRDLVAQAHIPDEQTGVSLLASMLDAPAATPPTLPPLPKRYMLFVGTRSVRKGFDELVQALVPIFERDPELRLVCAGRAFSQWERDALEVLGVADKVQAVGADDQQLIELYRRAICFVYPSFYEGFGLPVAEAMSLGCPVLTTPFTSMPEVGGDAVLYADPADPDAFRGQLQRLLNDPQLRIELAAKGKRRADAHFKQPRMIDDIAAQLREISR